MQHTMDRPPAKPFPSSEDGRDTLPQIHNTTEKDLSDAESDDIYRGSPPAHSPNIEDDSSSSSSSSSWSLFNGRLGAFTNLVSTLEQAISGWRGNSSSTPSSSSQTSIATVTRSQLSRRRKRRGSTHDFKRQQSERDFSARISLIKAREESRIVPRQFSLYLAPSLRSAGDTLKKTGEVDFPHSQRVLWTSSLNSVLNQLDAALKKATKTRRNRKDPLPSHNSTEINGEKHQHPMLPENLKAPSRAASFTDLAALRKLRKEKARDAAEVVVDADSRSMPAHNPWFLDVASPTSEDMRAIGKLLHLHPLTLEDILQQDPREKLERFPKLGYYFISFRAIESRTIRTKSEHQLDFLTDTGDEGLLMESNVYLVVFNEGVCSFHFMDVSEHIDRVRNRIISFEKSINMSSAWIAHSLLDSIVDSFFPFSDEIEKEVMAMEQLVYPSDVTAVTLNIPAKLETPEKVVSEKEPLPVLNEKNLMEHESISINTRTHFALSRPPLPLLYRRCLRYVRSFWRPSPSNEKSVPSSTMITLRRLARTRRLVTSLTRLLATKSEVVSQIRKRLLTGSGHENGTSSEEAEVAMYMGDVQDHILSLQHSLVHYERMLSQSHPTYLQQLRTHVSLAKSGADKALVYLTTVSMAVLCLQTVIGMFSQNVNVPASPDSFHVFGIIVSVECIVLTVYLGLVRRWWLNAKKGKGKALG